MTTWVPILMCNPCHLIGPEVAHEVVHWQPHVLTSGVVATYLTQAEVGNNTHTSTVTHNHSSIQCCFS